jgi:Protein of unknown function (DUF4236)
MAASRGAAEGRVRNAVARPPCRLTRSTNSSVGQLALGGPYSAAMGTRFRRSIRIAPGVRLNVTKTGVGLTAGGKLARYSVHSSGPARWRRYLPGSSHGGRGCQWLIAGGSRRGW